MRRRESCSCYPVEDFNNNNNNITKLSDGICEIAQCPQLSSFLLIFFFGLLFTSMNGTPTTIILLRCIPTEVCERRERALMKTRNIYEPLQN